MAVTNPAAAVLVVNQECLVAHPAVSVASVASVVASAHWLLALAVEPLVELVVVAKVESAEQVQVALLVQRS